MGKNAMSRRERRNVGSPEVWAKLVEKLDEKAFEMLSDIHSIHSLIGSIVRNRVGEVLGLGDDLDAYRVQEDRVLGISTSSIHAVPVAGVDSSITKPIRIAYRYYAAVSSAAIIYPRGRSSEPLERIYAYPRAAPDSANPPSALQELQLDMFLAEAQALTTAVKELVAEGGEPIVFLDGPIVDPPRFPAGNGLLRKYLSYIDSRAKNVLRILGQGGLVIGVVKRVYGSIFVESMAEDVEEFRALLERGVGDYGFALYASHALRELLSREGRDDYALVFKPHELPREGTDYQLYLERGVRVFSFLMVPRLYGSRGERRPIRVEVAVSREGKVDLESIVRRAGAAVAAWLVPGTNIPEPVLLAHEKCSIRRREASTMLREIVTRGLYHAARRMGVSGAEALLDFLL